MKIVHTLVALLVMLALSALAVSAQELPAGAPTAAGSPEIQTVKPTPAMREALYKQVWKQIAEQYIDETKLKDWDKRATKYDGKLNTDDELDAALTELVESVSDRWTKYMSPVSIATHKQMKEDGFLPSGLILRRHKDGAWHIDSLLFGSAAHQSVLREGDIIVAINGKRLTAKMTETEVFDLSLAQGGETVRVTAFFDGKEQQVELHLVPPAPDRVSVRMLPNEVLYIRLPTFENPQVVADFVRQLRKVYFEEKGSVTGVVFDLRNNSGGIFDLALEISSLFLESGTITKATVHKGANETVTEHNVRPMPAFAKRMITEPHALDFINWAYNTPLVVLINGSSASASEVTTGALQDNKRAYVIGTQSFGKSVGFSVNQLPNGGTVTITSLKYLTPAGHDILDKGITPDLVVEQPRGGTDDLALRAAHKHILELAAQRFQQMHDAQTIATKSHDELNQSDKGCNSEPCSGSMLLTLLRILAAGAFLAAYLLVSNHGRRLVTRVTGIRLP